MEIEEAVETIHYQMTEWLEEEEFALLVQKYAPHDIYIFKSSGFDSFCQNHFPEDYLKVAEKVAKAALRDQYHLQSKWIMWDDYYEEFKTSTHPLGFVPFRDMHRFIERLVMANDPLLKKVRWADEAIRVIRDAY